MRIRTLVLTAMVLAALASLVVASGTSAEPAGPASWATAPSLLQARAAHAVVRVGGSLIAIGGTGASGAPVSSVERFDGRRWKLETLLPARGGLNATAAVAIGPLVYVLGGFAGTGNVPTARVDVYDTASRKWSRAADLPSPRGGHAAVGLDGRIHVLGGGNSVSTLADHSVYDPASNRWSRAAPLGRAKGSPAAVVVGRRIYAIGGRSGTSDFGDVEIYDPAGDKWTTGPRISPRGTAGAAVYGHSIYLFGGESQSAGRTLDDVLRLRSGTDAWVKVGRMPTARAFARAVTYRGAVWVVGGSRVTASSHAAPGTGVVERLALPPGSR
jgi:N-acetylneuraminic acid mutarotase